MKRIMVTGAAGMLGSQLLLDCPADIVPVGVDIVEPAIVKPDQFFAGIDLTNQSSVAKLFDEAGEIDGVIHAAAYTAVDQAETEEDLATRVNGLATEHLARACKGRGIPLLLVGTDFVFDGLSAQPYKPEDTPHPLSAYGRTKLDAEQRLMHIWPEKSCIVRTQWLYGPRGRHFPGTILKIAAQRNEIKVVHDQIGCPTSTIELSPALWFLMQGQRPHTGIFHAACEGATSWCDFAKLILKMAGSSTQVVPCTTAEFPRPAVRPKFSVLDCSRLTQIRGITLGRWEDALRTFLQQEGLLKT